MRVFFQYVKYKQKFPVLKTYVFCFEKVTSIVTWFISTELIIFEYI